MHLQNKKITIPCSRTFEFIRLQDIIRFEGLQNYTKVFLKDGQSLISTNNIGVYKKQLTTLGFYCCHKSHLINEAHIARYHKDGIVQLSDDSSVPVSRRKRPITAPTNMKFLSSPMTSGARVG